MQESTGKQPLTIHTGWGVGVGIVRYTHHDVITLCVVILDATLAHFFTHCFLGMSRYYLAFFVVGFLPVLR